MEALLKHYLYGWHGPLLVNQGFASHIGWGFAVPLLGYWIARRRGLFVASAIWAAQTLFREFVEEPLDATTVSDLVSRLVPLMIVVAFELLRRRDRGAVVHPEVTGS
jgi:hypothetical protein